MKHLLRIILIFVLLAVVSLSGVIIAARLYFPPAKVVRYIQDGSLGFIGRAVKIGTLSYGLKGLDIQRFSVSNPPDFSAGTFLSLDAVHIGYVWHPLRLLITGQIGGLSCEGTIRYSPGGQSLVFDGLRLCAGDKLLVSSGTINNIRDTNNLQYTFSITGDRVVLDKVLELFPALAAFQYGDTATVRFIIEGSPQGVRITRK
jgi:hypothetical protein